MSFQSSFLNICEAGSKEWIPGYWNRKETEAESLVMFFQGIPGDSGHGNA